MNIMQAIVEPLEERIAAKDNLANRKYVNVQDLLCILVALLKRFCATGPTLSELLNEVDRVAVDMGGIAQREMNRADALQVYLDLARIRISELERDDPARVQLEAQIYELKNRNADLTKDLRESQDEAKRMCNLKRKAQEEVARLETVNFDLGADRGSLFLEVKSLKEEINILRRTAGLRIRREPSVECTHDHSLITSTGSAKCTACGVRLGWFCNESPDRTCHYTTHGGMVKLANGTKAPMPEGHDPQWETHDNCIYCNQPKERK